MRLANKADGRGSGIENRRQHIVIFGAAAHTFRHAKSGHRGAQGRRFGEKLAVGRIGAGPAAFDIVDTQGIQRQGDLALFRGRELHALRLLPVAQRGVEKIKPLAHRLPPANSFEGICNFLRRKLPGFLEKSGITSQPAQFFRIEPRTGKKFHPRLGHPHLDACGGEGGFQGINRGEILGLYCLLPHP